MADISDLKCFLNRQLIWNVDVEKSFDQFVSIAIAHIDNEIVGFEIYVRNEVRFAKFPWLIITLRANESWAQFCYVSPAYRGRRIIQSLTAFAAENLRREGIEFVFGLTRIGNTTARIAHTRRGFLPFGKLRAIQLLGLRIISINGKIRLIFSTSHNLAPHTVGMLLIQSPEKTAN